jgi:hypothetical protein
VRSFVFCTHPKILLGRLNQSECGGWDMWHALGEERKMYRVLVGKPPLGRPRCRREDGIRMDLREIDWGSFSHQWLCVGVNLGVLH